MEGYAKSTESEGAAVEHFNAMTGWLRSESAQGLTAAELEKELGARGRELMRTLLSDHLELRARKETKKSSVVGPDNVERRSTRESRRTLTSVFGDVSVLRLAYRTRRKGVGDDT